ncbi:MAG: type III secretion protein [Archangium sp.]|nr:type III secretion protein [Archangium sp.]
MSRLARLAALSSVLLFSACSVNLQHDLSEDDANDIYVLLQKSGIDASKLKEGEGKDAKYVISVPKADVASAAEKLRQHSLPRPRSDGLAIFKMTKGMIPTQTEERAMFIEAIGGEVSNALNRIPGVLEARTIVQIPEVNDLTQPEKKPQPTASVFMKFMPNEGKPPVSIEQVQAFVANSVPELKKENVTVLMTESKAVAEDANESRMQRIMGVNVDKASAGTFKTIIGVFALLFIVMAGLTAFLLVRKPAAPKAARSKTEG